MRSPLPVFGRVSACMLFAGLLLAQSPLTILNSTLPSGTVGQSYAAALSATGGTGPYTWFISGQIPPGLSLITSGVFTGTPITTGKYTFTLSVADSRGASTSKDFSITIGASSGLVITNSTLPPATVGQAYSQQLAASGGISPYQWSSPTLPAGLTLSSSGLLSGTPTTAGGFSLTVQVTDSANTTVSTQISLTVQAPPLTITTVPPLFVGTVGVSYAQPFSASGGQQPYRWSVLSGNTDGLTLDSASGSLTGTPSAAGTFTFTVQVSDRGGSSVTKSFSLSVNPPSLTISVAASLPAGTVGVAYSEKLPVQAAGGVPPYTWSLTGSAVPGLSLDAASLVLSGKPTTAGTYQLTVQAQDSSGLTATKALPLTISPALLTITTSRQLTNGVLNVPYSQAMAASGGRPPYRWSANGLPVGLAIDASTGLISGTPTTAGSFGVAITVSDSALTNYSDRFTMDVSLPPSPPVTLSGLPATVLPAQQYTLQVSLGSAYPAPINGQAIISFSPTTGPTDRTIQFASGGTTANFTIPTGSTTLDTPLAIQTGTVAGTLDISLRLQAGGIDITPTPAPSVTSQLAATAPVIRTALVNRSGSTLNVVVTGYSPAREITKATFTFTAAAGQTLQPAAASIVIDVTSLFGSWFLDLNNSQFGSVFVFTQPFTVQGDASAVIPASVTLTNRLGSTTLPVSQ